MPQRAPALVALIGIISGLLLSKHLALPAVQGLVTALPLACASWWFAQKGRPTLWLMTFLLASFIGFWTYGSLRLPLQTDDSLLPPREAQLTLKIERVMQTENTFGKATGIAHILEATETSRLSVQNRVHFRFSKYDTGVLGVTRGMRVQATGVLYPISSEVDQDSFEGYLRDVGIYHRFERTSGAAIIREAPFFKRFCREMNLRFQNFLRLGEPENRELSRIYIAMLLGLKAELTPEQTDRFRMTGTMHLFAISGLHIGVVATVIAQTLLMLRLPRAIRPFIGLPLVYLYVEITGGAPSAIRAFLMVTFFWLSIALQRQRTPLAALAASAVFVLIIQPSQLWQIGFQLSYLVVLSILLFGIPLHNLLWQNLRPYKYLPESSWTKYQKTSSWLTDKILLLFSISFSAWLASAPLSAGFFGFIAPYAVIVNMLLVNMAALVISGGVITLAVASAGFPALAAFLNHAAWVGISIMDGIVQFNISIPGAIIECPGFPKSITYFSVLAYFLVLFYPSDRRSRTLRYIVAICLILLSLLSGFLVT